MLRHHIEHADYSAITQLAGTNKRVLSELIALTLSEDDLIGWRAVNALGQASAVVAARDAEFVRGILRRLMWSLNDESGSIGWRAPQAMGAIIAAAPDQFAEFAPIVASMLDLDETHFYPGVLWAIGQIAPHLSARIQFALAQIRECLRADSPATRAMAAWCSSRLNDTSAIESLERLQTDEMRVQVFEDDNLHNRTVGEIARAVLTQLKMGLPR